MYYALIASLAIVLLIINNFDILFRKKGSSSFPGHNVYRGFLIAVFMYYVTDVFWGIFHYLKLPIPLFVDTELYFVAMALGILFWTRYINDYLGGKDAFRYFMHFAGIIFFFLVFVSAIINIFYPVLFYIDEQSEYHTGFIRNFVFVMQIGILVFTSAYALIVSARSEGAQKNRHFTIGLFGVVMLLLIAVQCLKPLLPLYSVGYMLGISLLRTFVIENEKEEYRKNLELALEREKKELRELNSAWRLAYTDAMTGAKSKLAFGEKQDKMDQLIYSGKAPDFAIAVFDVNGLKQINDTQGHEAGDKYIISAFRLICRIFRHSPVFRLGGDEFAAVLENSDYENRKELLNEFNKVIEDNKKNNKVVIAGGIAEYDPEQDSSWKRVFERADGLMYQRKSELKQR